MSSDPDTEMEPGECGSSSSVAGEMEGLTLASQPQPHREYIHLPRSDLFHFLLHTDLNCMLAGFLPTRDLFYLQFLNRSIFTLCNSNATLLQVYYSSARLNSFIPFMVDDLFLQAFLTPSYLDLPDGSRAVRNTYSMHIRHLYLNFCTRISNHALGCIAMHTGGNLLTLNLEGGGRSRINEIGMRGLFSACVNLTDLNLNGFYQLNMVDTMTALTTHCRSIKHLSLNGCSQMNDSAISILCRVLRLHSLHLNCSNVTDFALQHISSGMGAGLKLLHIGYNGSISDRGIANLVTHCRNLEDLNLYGCYGLSRHSLSYLRLCPRLRVVDISRIHSLDDTSIAEWILPMRVLQHQQQVVLQLVQQSLPPGSNLPTPQQMNHPDYNANLPQIFQAVCQQEKDSTFHESSIQHLTTLSLDSDERITSLSLKVLLENCPRLTFINAFGVSNLSTVALHSLFKIVQERSLPLEELEIGGGGTQATLNPREMEMLRQNFKKIKF